MNVKYCITTFLVFGFVSFICILLITFSSTSCKTLYYYNYNVFFGIGKLDLLFALKCIIALGLYLLLRLMSTIYKNKSYQLLFFAILPLIIFSTPLYMIPKKIKTRPITSSICSKSTTDGMTTKSNNLNYAEYIYIKKQLQLLPTIPDSAKYIYLKYYHDNFLSDYHLEVNCTISKDVLIDTTNSNWLILSKDTINNTKVIYYYNGSS